MAEDPGHKAMLYFLEVLMNSNGPLSISQMAGRFGSRTFSPEMRTAAGGNEAGLRKFLLKYPSLFQVNGNLISLNDSGSAPAPALSNSSSSSSLNSNTPTTPSRTVTDLSLETEAVLFFQNRLAKKDEKWCQIKSLAGHLSQAPVEVRNIVGPQNEFKKFLLKHPHVFEVQGELVGLRDSFSSASYNTNHLRKSDSFSKPPVRPKNLKFAQRSHSNPITPLPKTPNMTPLATPTTPSTNKPGPITMTANEYKAVMYIKSIIEKKGKIKLHNLTGHFSQAVESVRNTIGWTKTELEEFLMKNQNMFTIDEEEYVGIKKTPKLHVIITGSRPQGQSAQTLTNRRGKIFHVAKLWGIIDLGKHEHVFFDRSIYTQQCEDLQRDFQIGEMLNFNAVLAPKDSRAKWKATQIWRDGEVHSDSDRTVTFGDSYSSGPVSPSTSIEEEISRLLPNDFDPAEIMKQLKDDPFNDATPSGTGSVPVWNNRSNDHSRIRSTSDLPEISPSISMVPENYFMYASSMEDVHKALPDYIQLPDPSDVVSPIKHKSFTNHKDAAQNGETNEPRCRDIGCQTISTGEVLATQLYHEGFGKDKEKPDKDAANSDGDSESQ
ncbi:uncharacterized protein LOC135490815 isoform X2 [Lineus longissimus]